MLSCLSKKYGGSGLVRWEGVEPRSEQIRPGGEGWFF
ncbi:hypothetical protein H206_06977 [Candidatus Electrothrix aarhusensis]|uniref:Uncharacterized protein n=1 Tax=Candidatus Electrothrix aarhusensis TaxID=1859131 RepID=A0A444J3X1_9BACT|nr:hypothetical protein H206_06977 [Candidatus Electrothrix aarhusensis]